MTITINKYKQNDWLLILSSYFLVVDNFHVSICINPYITLQFLAQLIEK